MTLPTNTDVEAVQAKLHRGLLITLFLIFAGLLVTPAMADQAKIDKAVASYTGTTLPAIAKMKPLIGKSASERAQGFAKMGIGDKHCDAAAIDAIYGHQHLAEGAANLCRTLMRWMANDEILTCEGAKYAGVEMAQTSWPPDPVVAKRHKSNGVEKTRLQLRVAAGCTKRDATYWGVKALEQYDLMSAQIAPAGDLIAPAAGGQIPTLETIEKIERRCSAARNLADPQNTGVIEGAVSGCFGLRNLVEKDFADACKGFNDGLKDISANPDMPSFRDAEAALKAKLVDRLFAPVCAPTVAKLLQEKADRDKAAAEKARLAAASAPPPPSGPTQAQQANALIGIINGEQQSYNTNLQFAKSWDDRGETKLACGYNQKALNNLSVLQETYGKLGDVMRTTEHRGEIARLKKIQSDYYNSEWESCKEAGYLLYN